MADDIAFPCFSWCDDAMIKKIESDPNLNRTQLNPFWTLPPPTCLTCGPYAFDVMCNVMYKERMECIDDCPDGQLKFTYTDMASMPHKFMCIDRYEDFKQHLPCITSTCSGIEKTCKSECQQYTVSFSDMYRTQAAHLPYNVSAAMETVKNGCSYASCYINCTTPLFEQKCSAKAATLQRDYVKQLTKMVTKFLSKSLLPSSCQAIVN